MVAGLREADGEKRPIGLLLQRASGLPQARHHALLEVVADLVLDVLLEATDDQTLVAIILARVVVGIRNSRRVKKAHQRSKTAGRAVMWSSRKQDQRIGPIGELPRESRAAGEVGFSRASRDIVAFVDYDNIPPGILKIIPVFEIAL